MQRKSADQRYAKRKSTHDERGNVTRNLFAEYCIVLWSAQQVMFSEDLKTL